MEVGIFEAKAKLSELVDQANAGREVIITRHGQPVARISPVKRSADKTALVEEIKRFSKGLKLPKGVTIRELIDEGR